MGSVPVPYAMLYQGVEHCGLVVGEGTPEPVSRGYWGMMREGSAFQHLQGRTKALLCYSIDK